MSYQKACEILTRMTATLGNGKPSRERAAYLHIREEPDMDGCLYVSVYPNENGVIPTYDPSFSLESLKVILQTMEELRSAGMDSRLFPGCFDAAGQAGVELWVRYES